MGGLPARALMMWVVVKPSTSMEDIQTGRHREPNTIIVHNTESHPIYVATIPFISWVATSGR